MGFKENSPDATKMDYKERKDYQHPHVVKACETLVAVSHKHIPEGSRIARIDIVLDVPHRTRSIILDYSPAIRLYIDSDGNVTASLIK